SAPLCTNVSLPVAGSTDFPANGTITWAAAQYAAGYKIYIGTTPGGTDIANGTVVTGTTYKPALQANTMYYLKVVPYNTVGDAAGCTEISFTTTTVQYCGPLTYSTVEPTTNVTFAGINNTTSAAVGGSPAHEFFLDKIGTVLTNTTYPISMNANTDGTTFRHFFAVFIDWNQDGDFDDASEKYFTTPETFVFVLGSNGVTGTPAVGSIVVPENAKLGQTRMRVKSAFYGSSGPNTEPNLSDFANACVTTGSSYGQVEDYTIQVNSATTGTSNVDKAKVTAYPNPFHDVLNISDVKGVKSVSVSDVAGRLVKNMKVATQLNLSDLKTGMYIVTLHMEDGSAKSIKTIKK
ncbi:MAG: T9SS type A sorting domain-containing protein, partial [Kaistella sp.]|nr:T9SS type A sorting domain-containing protein [Kaistella sp.]